MNKARSAVIVSAVLTILFAITSPGWTITEQSVDPYGTFAGSGAGASNTSDAEYNAFFGYRAGYVNDYGAYNAFAGAEAGHANTTGSSNTFIGYQAGYMNVSGSYNTFVGYFAGYSNLNTDCNTYVGSLAGINNRGSNNVFIGSQSGFFETAASNTLYIANSSTDTPLIYGNFTSGQVKINGRLVFPSDERLKENVEPLKASLDRVMRLKAISYDWKDDINRSKGRNIGLIAQDVGAVLPALVHTGFGGYKALSYDRFIPVLVEAIKEQQVIINEQGKELEAKSMISDSHRKAIAGRKAVIMDITGQLNALSAEVNKLKGKTPRQGGIL